MLNEAKLTEWYEKYEGLEQIIAALSPRGKKRYERSLKVMDKLEKFCLKTKLINTLYFRVEIEKDPETQEKVVFTSETSPNKVCKDCGKSHATFLLDRYNEESEEVIS